MVLQLFCSFFAVFPLNRIKKHEHSLNIVLLDDKKSSLTLLLT